MRDPLLAYAAQSEAAASYSVDFTFDGDVNLGPVAPKRASVSQLRTLVEDYLRGPLEGRRGENKVKQVVPLDLALGTFFGNLERAIRACREEAQRCPEQEDFFSANLEYYRLIGESIENMDQALEDEDDEALLAGLAQFEEAAQEIDKLVRREALEAENY